MMMCFSFDNEPILKRKEPTQIAVEAELHSRNLHNGLFLDVRQSLSKFASLLA